MTWMIKTSKVEKWCQNVSWLLWCAYITNQCGAFRDADAEKVFLDDAQMRSWVRNFIWQEWNSYPANIEIFVSVVFAVVVCSLFVLIFGPFSGTPFSWCWWCWGWNQPRSELKTIVASWRSQYSLLKHYSSPVSLTCHFPQCVFAAKTTPRWAVFAAYLT